MRKLLITGLLALSLGACTSTQVQNAEAFIAAVQAQAASAIGTGCKFVPTVDTILAIAASLGFAPAVPAAGAVNAVAAAICSQVPPPASAAFKSLPLKGGPAATVGAVNGVAIHGWRVP